MGSPSVGGNGVHYYEQWAAPAFIPDISLYYNVTSSMQAAIGTDNAINKLPAHVATPPPRLLPLGFDGGHYYSRITFAYRPERARR